MGALNFVDAVALRSIPPLHPLWAQIPQLPRFPRLRPSRLLDILRHRLIPSLRQVFTTEDSGFASSRPLLTES